MKIMSPTTILGVIVVSLHALAMAAPHEPMRDLIINGRDAEIGEFPSFAAGLGCGGTLIHEDIVLTAAHCNVDGATAFEEYVQIGGTLNPTSDDPDGEIIPTVCYLNHPDYVPIDAVDRMGRYDIALIKLAIPSTGPLMKLNFDPAFPAVNQTVTAIGYGISGYGTAPLGQISPPIFADILQVLSPLYIQSEAVCSLYDTEDYSVDFHLCVDDNDPASTACAGDSGGPIFTENMVQVGLSSYGLRNPITLECLGDIPDYWTSVAAHESFIKSGICALSYNPPADCPKDVDLSLLMTCLDPPTSSPTNVPSSSPSNAPSSAPTKASKKSSKKGKGMMSEDGMSSKGSQKMDGMGMKMSKKAKTRYLK